MYKKGTSIANVDWTPDSKQGKAYIAEGYTYIPPTTSAPIPAPVPTPTPIPIPTPTPPVNPIGYDPYSVLSYGSDGKIVRGLDGRQFKNPNELASFLGISSDKIDWTKIKSGTPTPTPAPVTGVPPITPPPSVVTTSDTIRADEKASSQPYIKYAGSPDVFNQSTGQHITAEQAAQIPNFWNQVYNSNNTKPEGLLTPIQSIQKVFGSTWKPSAAFTPELQAQGIFGAVRVGNDVYTLGPGGSYETQESFEKKFGTRNQEGIVSEVNYDQAKALGITIKTETLSEPLQDISLDPLDSPSSNAQTIQEIKDAADKANKVEEAKIARDKAQDDLIKFIADFGKNLAEATQKAKDESGLDAASAAITAAQTAAATLRGEFMAAKEAERGRPQSMASMTGRQARIEQMMAVQLYPLDQAVLIAQGNWTRADNMFDDAMDSWKTGVEWGLKAAQENVDKLGMDLTDAQQKAKDEAQIKIDFAMADYEQKLETQQEVKKMSLAYPEAKITVGDSWETAYKKAAPFIKDEADLKKKMGELDLKLKEAQIGSANRANIKTSVAGSGASSALKVDGKYASDLDAMIGRMRTSVVQENRREAFDADISSARNESDVLNSVAKEVLTTSSPTERQAFSNNVNGVRNIDKAIAELNKGVQTGLFNNSAQYLFNLFGEDYDANLYKVRQDLIFAVQPYRNQITGAAWGQKEEEDYQQLFGTTKFSPEELKNRLEGVKRNMIETNVSFLDTKASPFGGVNLFEQSNQIIVPTDQSNQDNLRNKYNY